MARVELPLPETFSFATEIAVRMGDLNFVNHLGNAEALSILQEARARFLASHGYSELDLGGVGFVVADVVIVYRSQALYSDVLTIEICAGDFNEYGCDFYFRVTRPGERREVLRAKTGIVCFDYRAQVKRPLPPAVRAALATGACSLGTPA